MDSISKDVALKFCKICEWAYEVWVTHTHLFDENEARDNNIEKSAYFTRRLCMITQEYALQQIAKLHDPAIQGNSLNLTIDYIVRFGEWGEKASDIEKISNELFALWKHLKAARNKIIAHNDLEAFMANSTLGSFPKDMDIEYFTALQALVNEVHEKWVGGPYLFSDLAKTDVLEFLALLERVR